MSETDEALFIAEGIKAVDTLARSVSDPDQPQRINETGLVFLREFLGAAVWDTLSTGSEPSQELTSATQTALELFLNEPNRLKKVDIGSLTLTSTALVTHLDENSPFRTAWFDAIASSFNRPNQDITSKRKIAHTCRNSPFALIELINRTLPEEIFKTQNPRDRATTLQALAQLISPALSIIQASPDANDETILLEQIADFIRKKVMKSFPEQIPPNLIDSLLTLHEIFPAWDIETTTNQNYLYKAITQARTCAVDVQRHADHILEILQTDNPSLLQEVLNALTEHPSYQVTTLATNNPDIPTVHAVTTEGTQVQFSYQQKKGNPRVSAQFGKSTVLVRTDLQQHGINRQVPSVFGEYDQTTSAYIKNAGAIGAHETPSKTCNACRMHAPLPGKFSNQQGYRLADKPPLQGQLIIVDPEIPQIADWIERHLSISEPQPTGQSTFAMLAIHHQQPHHYPEL